MKKTISEVGSVFAIFFAGALIASTATWGITSVRLIGRQLEVVDRAAEKTATHPSESENVLKLLADVRKQIVVNGPKGREMAYIIMGACIGSVLFFTGLYLRSRANEYYTLTSIGVDSSGS